MNYDDRVWATVFGASFFPPKPQRPHVPNTFRRVPEPRPGYVDARREDHCIPDITSLPGLHPGFNTL